MKNGKRIESITIRHITDVDPDTSYMGKYSSKPEGDYSIDRVHSLDCILNNPQTSQPVIEQLSRVISYLTAQRREIGNDSDNPYYWGLSEACDTVGTAQDELFGCDCGESGSMGRHEYRYFNPSGNYKGEPLADIVKYTKQDYERMEDLNKGRWNYIGIMAQAKIVVEGHIQRITSGGRCGIESDSDDSDFAEVEADELADLKSQLKALGFSTRSISAAFKTVDRDYE